MKIIKGHNLSVVKEKHINKWVALSPDYKQLLAVGDNLSTLLAKTKTSKKVVIKVLPNLSYAPMHCSIIVK